MTAPIPGFQRPAPEVAIAGQPSAEQLAELKQEGFRSVVSLRPASENTGFDEPAEAARLGLSYFHSKRPGKASRRPVVATPIRLPN